MNKSPLPDWFPQFPLSSPLFDPLTPLTDKFSGFEHWPQLADFQALLNEQSSPITTLTGKCLKIVEQEGKPSHFEQHYAPRIYMTGEIQTRLENWHDFFQYLTWIMFPKTKAIINSIHIPHARARITQGGDIGARSPIENMLSLFDEGGAVIISSDPSLLELIREFRWKELFWERRTELASKFRCITFGHAMYEKALTPYIGMTANCILLHCDESIINQSWLEQWRWVDEQLATIFSDGEILQKPKDLAPFPILGMPGWDKNNADEAYYDNQSYFRTGRRTKT
ncbi:MAG: DUF3025 domain-containing protein [Gammaproteobacteria bacterium]|nr:DUF3025 domain-containing protein [Gammaproteobacteria bacterium]